MPNSSKVNSGYVTASLGNVDIHTTLPPAHPAPGRCPDCGCQLGHVHHPGCDMACCRVCLVGQALSCHLDDDTTGIVLQ